MDRENYFILLELPSDPPASDPAVIRAAIGKKKQEWTRWQDHPGKRPLALVYLASLSDIEQTLLDPVSRKNEAKQAKVVLKEMARRFEAELRILEGKGHLLPREVTAIAAKYKVYGIDQETVYKLAKVSVSEHPPEREDTEEPGEVLDRLTAKTIERDLGILGFGDLYLFLGEPRYSSIKKLTGAAEERRRAAGGQKSAESVAAQELAGICLRLFESFDAKQKYDRYLKISKYPALGEMVDEEFTRQKYIGNESLLRLINYGVESYRCSVLEAEEYIRRYCESYRIPVGSEKPIIRCPACKNQIARESVVCQHCAAPTKGNCPACATPYEEGPAACAGCGFLIGDMVKALGYLETARGAVIDGNWSTSKRNLEYAAKYWPDHPEIAQLESRAQGLEKRYSAYVDQLSDCVSKNQHYAALELIAEAEEKGIKLPGATVKQVKRMVTDLENQLDKLSKKDAPDINHLLQLAAAVTDSMELTRMLSAYPPAPPSRLKGENIGRQVNLNWQASDSPGMIRYLVVRKRDDSPFTAFDGDVLYNGPACSFMDKTAEPLTEYHYKVYAMRGSSYSKDGSSFGPIMVVPEIEQLRIFPADQGAQLTWAFNPDIRKVIIWRKLGGERPTAPEDGILLETERIDSFVDSKIKNDVEYWYYLCAVYSVDGKQVVSKGVSDIITPRKIIAPVERLSIVKSDYENEYVVNWSGMDAADLILLASTKKPAIKIGEMFAVQDLLAHYRNLALHTRSADSGRFRHSFTGGIYVFAAIVVGKYAVVGQPQYLTNLRDVENLTADLIDGDLYLNMKWPVGLNEVIVAYKNDGYPAFVDELGLSTMKVTREQYDYDAGVVLRELAPGAYYFKVFASYPAPEGEQGVSEGAQIAFQYNPRAEIFYRISYRKRPLKKQAELSLTLHGPSGFTLPPIELVIKNNSLPLSRQDGDSLALIDQTPRVNGEVEFQYQIDRLPSGAHMRVFFIDDGQYKKFRLLPSGELKIT
ncbi:MAG: hypothetical protein FWE32_02945 [Oscillospiraceae bacterium]|nr:hypothetical protein [Oscillospiraceae bacterium]